MDAYDLTNDPRAVAAIRAALAEDIGSGDATTLALVDPAARAEGALLAREACRVAGADVGKKVFERVDSGLQVEIVAPDSADVAAGGVILTVRGAAASILTAERTALNFLQRLCGVATTSSRYAAALAGTGTVVLDTRKTTPGYRNLEKYAVAVGGATNHRIGLFDRVMIKDNHREMAAMEGAGGIARSVKRARAAWPKLEVQVEADSLDEVREAADAGADYILLDNMSDETMAEAVKIVHGRSKLEASGNITIERLPRIGRIGVDFASSGALTHSVKSSDISLDIEVNQ